MTNEKAGADTPAQDPQRRSDMVIVPLPQQPQNTRAAQGAGERAA